MTNSSCSQCISRTCLSRFSPRSRSPQPRAESSHAHGSNAKNLASPINAHAIAPAAPLCHRGDGERPTSDDCNASDQRLTTHVRSGKRGAQISWHRFVAQYDIAITEGPRLGELHWQLLF